MKLFVDSANLDEIQEALTRGFVAGITTNPSILAREKMSDFREHITRIVALIQTYGEELPLSVEVLTTDPAEMVSQAEGLVKELKYANLYIKIPVGWNELKVIRQLRAKGIRVNCTACMSFNQAVLAAQAGANFVSLFWGRIRDTGYDASLVVRQTHATFREWNCPSQIIVGSIRHIMDVNEAIQAGADIVTVPPKFFPLMCAHPKTDEVIHQFLTDFQRRSEGQT